MKKVHIVTLGYQDFAVDSISAANSAVALFSKLKPVRLNHSAENSGDWFYEPDEDRARQVKLELNRPYKEPKPIPSPKPGPKAMALPKPKRGTILCICEKSYVAPRESCPSCGRPFAESHARTHDSKPTGPNLRLL